MSTPNPNDATLRNVRAAHTRLAALTARVKRLETLVATLKKASRR